MQQQRGIFHDKCILQLVNLNLQLLKPHHACLLFMWVFFHRQQGKEVQQSKSFQDYKSSHLAKGYLDLIDKKPFTGIFYTSWYPLRSYNIYVDRSKFSAFQTGKSLTLPLTLIKTKINLNFYFHVFLWCRKRFYEDLNAFIKKLS